MIQAVKVPRERIEPLRREFLAATRFQLRYFAVHERGWSDSYLMVVDGLEAGFGSVRGQEIPDRDTVFGFFVRPAFADSAREIFGELLRASQFAHIECSSHY